MANNNNLGDESPDSRTVTKFHQNDDVDTSTDSHHHTIGRGPNQAASGAHNHRDGNGAPILGGLSITGSKAGTNQVFLASVAAALVVLGVEDKST